MCSGLPYTRRQHTHSHAQTLDSQMYRDKDNASDDFRQPIASLVTLAYLRGETCGLFRTR